jgi:protein O-GlcNAc transferase
VATEPSSGSNEVPADPEALFHLGNLARRQGAFDDAIRHFEQALALAPDSAVILNNLGLTLAAVGRQREAEARFRAAHALAPDSFEPLANLAQNLFKQGHFDAALPFFDRLVTRFDISSASLWANRAECQANAGDLDGARRSLQDGLARAPASPGLLRDLGFHEIQRRNFAAAADAFERVQAIEPNSVLAGSALLVCRQYIADWRDFDRLRAMQIKAAAHIDDSGAQSIVPFTFLTICDDPALQRKAAASWMRRKVLPSAARPAKRAARPLHLCFLAADLFAAHPVVRLIVELLERLDRKHFHVAFYALGARADDGTRQRLQQSVDTLVEVSGHDADALAERIRNDAIDVLFDLDGLTGRTLVDLFARRPAALQVNFLGYTGTMGTAAYDRIIADRHCLPESDAVHYTEKPLYIEPCYMPSDSRRVLDPAPVSRAQYGLPEDATVLCAFANTYKILPGMFAAWMALLAARPATVLWLRSAGDAANARLRAEAKRHGVDGARLCFAKPDPVPRYLSRFRLADLFLDTTPFGAHTTVNDALWAGLPVLTVDGSGFAGRASASQVHAAGLSDLVAKDLADYGRIANRLLGAPALLADVAHRLRTAGRDSPLFDGAQYAARFGDAILAAWEDA